jgi:hypothetical protein
MPVQDIVGFMQQVRDIYRRQAEEATRAEDYAYRLMVEAIDRHDGTFDELKAQWINAHAMARFEVGLDRGYDLALGDLTHRLPSLTQ